MAISRKFHNYKLRFAKPYIIRVTEVWIHGHMTDIWKDEKMTCCWTRETHQVRPGTGHLIGKGALEADKTEHATS